MISGANLRRRAAIVGSAAVLSIGGLSAVASAAGATTSTIGAPAASAAVRYSCSAGYFCIYSDWNGGGHRCQWSQSKVSNTADACSWIRTGLKVRSVYNRTNHRVQYYTRTNYNSRVGSTPSGGRGSLMGTYQIRSFKPQ